MKKRMSAARALNQMRAAGIHVSTAWEFYQSHHPNLQKEGFSIQDTVEDFLASSKKRGVRERTLQNYTRELNKFAAYHRLYKLGHLNRVNFQAYLARYGTTPDVTRGILSILGTWWRHCWRNDWVKDGDMVAKLDRPRREIKSPKILSLDQCAETVGWARKWGRSASLWLAGTLFLGIRQEEWSKLSAECWNLDEEHLLIPAYAAKSGRPRRIDYSGIAPVAAFLREHPAAVADATARPYDTKTRRRELFGRLETGSQNILRHTGASHLVNLMGSHGMAALVLGTSEGILMRHYFNPPTKTDTELFYALRF